MSDEDVLSTVIPLFQKLSQDDQDSVRLLTVEVLAALAKRVNEGERKELLLPAFATLSTDKAWRVRYMVASKYVEVNAIKISGDDFDFCSLPMPLGKILYESTLQKPL